MKMLTPLALALMLGGSAALAETHVMTPMTSEELFGMRG